MAESRWLPVIPSTANVPDCCTLPYGTMSGMAFYRLAPLAFLGVLSLACGGTPEIDTAAECIDSFRVALDDQEPEVRPPKSDELAWAAFQGADEWEGRTPVCWVNYGGPNSCHGFMFDLEGTWGPAEWTDSGSHPGACPPEGAGTEFDV